MRLIGGLYADLWTSFKRGISSSSTAMRPSLSGSEVSDLLAPESHLVEKPQAYEPQLLSSAMGVKFSRIRIHMLSMPVLLHCLFQWL